MSIKDEIFWTQNIHGGQSGHGNISLFLDRRLDLLTRKTPTKDLGTVLNQIFQGRTYIVAIIGNYGPEKNMKAIK